MSACEWCWSAASKRAMLCGGNVTDRYHEMLEEQNNLGPHADCPEARADAVRKMTERRPTR